VTLTTAGATVALMSFRRRIQNSILTYLLTYLLASASLTLSASSSSSSSSAAAAEVVASTATINNQIVFQWKTDGRPPSNSSFASVAVTLTITLLYELDLDIRKT